MLPSRRQFVGTTLSAAMASSALAAAAEQPAAGAREPRLKIAAIATAYFPTSHAQHIIGRFLYGYTRHGKHHQPAPEVVSLYVAQKERGDMSEQVAKKFGLRLCSSIGEALVLDQDRLAVDGILFVGEHGRYPVNEIGQRMYPRHDFVKEFVAEFRRSGRSVPVFSDKHLSYSWEKAAEMVAWSRELKFPLQAGSALAVTWRRPELELPLGTPIEEAVAIGYGPPDSYGFHALEMLQCHMERRQGGETGLRRVQLVTGEAAWTAVGERLAGASSVILDNPATSRTQALFRAALNRSYTRAIEDFSELRGSPQAYLLEYNDGLRATVFLHEGLVNDFTFAAKIRDQPKPVSTLHFLAGTPAVAHFGAVAWNCEQLFATGKAVLPVERTLLVSGALEALHQSLHRKSQPVETPHLKVTYKGLEDSGYLRGAIDPIGQAEAARGPASPA